MPRPKLRDEYSYYNFQLPPKDKERLQARAHSQEQALSSLLLNYVRACDLLRQVAKERGQVKVTMDGSWVNVAYNGTIIKI